MLHFRPDLLDSQFKCVAASITEAQIFRYQTSRERFKNQIHNERSPEVHQGMILKERLA